MVGLLSLWVAFKASKVSISSEISSKVTNKMEKQSEEFLACLMSRTLVFWRVFSIVLWTGSTLKSDTVKQNFNSL